MEEWKNLTGVKLLGIKGDSLSGFSNFLPNRTNHTLQIFSPQICLTSHIRGHTRLRRTAKTDGDTKKSPFRTIVY